MTDFQPKYFNFHFKLESKHYTVLATYCFVRPASLKVLCVGLMTLIVIIIIKIIIQTKALLLT